MYQQDIMMTCHVVILQEQWGYDELKVAITSDGFVQWHVSTNILTSCEIDVRFYPYDTQKCM